MAYVSVISLARTLEQLVQRKPHWISDDTRKMVDSILDSLEYVQDFLENTSKTRQDCGKLEELEREVRTVANKAEDVIELKIYEINGTLKKEASSKTFLTTLVKNLKREVMGCRSGKNKVPNETMERKTLRKTLLPFVKMVDAMKRNMMGSSFGTNEVQGYVDPTNENLPLRDSLLGNSSRQVANMNLEDVVVGLEDDLMKIKRRLTGPPSTREIITILGMGGIGKTTLAKKAYDDPEIRRRFDIHVWVTVSQDYQIRELLLGVVSCVTQLKIKIKEESIDELMDTIRKKLMNKRYLVVMDDIWSNDVWDLMTRTFPDDNNGSRIILTSRLNDVAMHADPDSPPHKMRLLNADKSLKLLHDKVFGVKEHVCLPELEDIGDQIAKRCHGLPLALVVVAGHLSKIARTRESWEEVSRNVSEVVANDSDDKCLGVLAMSYNYLPNHLKPCFLYMGAFPEDRPVDIKRLINLWVSEGFVSEEMGRDCLGELVSRNLLMVRKRRFNGEWKTCCVHDLVRDLILREIEKEKFLQIHDHTTPPAKKLRARRHIFHSYLIYDPYTWNISSCLTRTMHFSGGLSQCIPLENFKLLRVLAILDVTFPYFPMEITKLVHLRYLEFRCDSDIDCSVSELYNLQTLIFYYDGDKPATIVPQTIWRMKHLRHLQVGFVCFIGSGEVKSGFKLEKLEELSCLNLCSCTFELFSAIPNLKRLRVHARPYPCLGEEFYFYQHLNSLSCLKKLDILKFRGGALISHRIRTNYDFPTSLKRLTLSYTDLPWEDMANIVMLPNLEVLKIKENGFDGDVWRLNDEEIFNQLKFLLIDRTNLKHWEASSANFPKLQRLVLKRCYWLEEVPQDFGEICTLESIKLHHCSFSSAKSVEEIQEEQVSMGNVGLNVLVDNCRVINKRDKIESC